MNLKIFGVFQKRSPNSGVVGPPKWKKRKKSLIFFTVNMFQRPKLLEKNYFHHFPPTQYQKYLKLSIFRWSRRYLHHSNQLHGNFQGKKFSKNHRTGLHNTSKDASCLAGLAKNMKIPKTSWKHYQNAQTIRILTSFLRFLGKNLNFSQPLPLS